MIATASSTSRNAPIRTGPGAAGQRNAWPKATGLAEDVRRYGEWMRDEAKKAVLWARTKRSLLGADDPNQVPRDGEPGGRFACVRVRCRQRKKLWLIDFDDADIVEGTSPGGANTSRSMQLPALINLLSSLPAAASFEQYQAQAIDQNLLGKSTYEGRKRAFRYLREDFLLDRRRIVFRALRDLWDEDPNSRRLLAGLCAFARDSVYRATGDAVLAAFPGEQVGSDQLVATLRVRLPGTYSDAYARKIARNTGASWSQSGHLTDGAAKHRRLAIADAPSTAYALLLGYLQGVRGQALFATPWLQFLDVREAGRARELANLAARRGYLEYRETGEVVDISFKHLLRGLGAQ